MTASATKSDRFFTNVNRLLSLLGLVVLLGGVVVVAYLARSSGGPNQRPGVVEVEDNSAEKSKPVELFFSEVEKIHQSDTEMIRLKIADASGSYVSSSGRGGEIRNALFVSGSSKPAHWLFTGHKNVVQALEQLGEGEQSGQQKETLALYVEFKPHQPGGKSEKDRNRPVDVGLARPDGSGFATVLKGVARVLSHRVVEGRRVNVLFQHDTAIRQASISLDDFTIISEREIEKLPTSL